MIATHLDGRPGASLALVEKIDSLLRRVMPDEEAGDSEPPPRESDPEGDSDPRGLVLAVGLDGEQ